MTSGADQRGVLSLADKICGFDGSAVVEPVRAQARNAIIETISLTIAGMGEVGPQLLLKTSGIAKSPGVALVLGTDTRTGVLDAAFVNGVASRAKADIGAAASGPLVAALLALGEERKASGKQFLFAYLAGVETEARLNRMLRSAPDQSEWQPGAGCGTVSVAAAASHLMKLDSGQVATALAIAASFAGGFKANFAAKAEPLLGGQCARDGLMAALLAEAGYDASHSIPELDQHSIGDDDLGRGVDGVEASDDPWEKFNDRVRKILPREQIAPPFEPLDTLDTAADVNQITQLMQVSHLHDRGVAKPVSFARRGTEEAQETNWVP